jgi:hypothetical protein
MRKVFKGDIPWLTADLLFFGSFGVPLRKGMREATTRLKRGSALPEVGNLCSPSFCLAHSTFKVLTLAMCQNLKTVRRHPSKLHTCGTFL